MKNRNLTGSIILPILFALTAGAQQPAVRVNEPDLNRPKLFAQLPEKISITTAQLERLIANNTETGKDVSLDLNGKQTGRFDGKVVSASSKYGNKIRSIVIRSTTFNGATFSLSSTVQADGSIRYSGRIISFQHGDLYELQPNGQDYILVKKNFYDLVNE